MCQPSNIWEEEGVFGEDEEVVAVMMVVEKEKEVEKEEDPAREPRFVASPGPPPLPRVHNIPTWPPVSWRPPSLPRQAAVFSSSLLHCSTRPTALHTYFGSPPFPHTPLNSRGHHCLLSQLLPKKFHSFSVLHFGTFF